MEIKILIAHIILIMYCASGQAQYIQPSTKKIIDEIEQYQLQNQPAKSINIVDEGIEHTKVHADLAYLYAYKTSIYASLDSLLIAKRNADLSMQNAIKSNQNTAIAVAYRAKAFLNNRMNITDDVVKDALEGLKLVENTDEDLVTKYHLNYLLYGAYSKWDDGDKMENYIRIALQYAYWIFRRKYASIPR